MKVQYDPDFITKLKKLNVRIRKSFKERMTLFLQNPNNTQLHNHGLGKPYEGLKSIDITADYRAIFEEIQEKNETLIYFIIIGTHKELYK